MTQWSLGERRQFYMTIKARSLELQGGLRYWIDNQGRVWKGPVSPDDTLHYAVFQGHMEVPPYRWIWSCWRSSPPEIAWASEVTEAEALAITGPEYLRLGNEPP